MIFDREGWSVEHRGEDLLQIHGIEHWSPYNNASMSKNIFIKEQVEEKSLCLIIFTMFVPSRVNL